MELRAIGGYSGGMKKVPLPTWEPKVSDLTPYVSQISYGPSQRIREFQCHPPPEAAAEGWEPAVVKSYSPKGASYAYKTQFSPEAIAARPEIHRRALVAAKRKEKFQEYFFIFCAIVAVPLIIAVILAIVDAAKKGELDFFRPQDDQDLEWRNR